MEEHTNYVKRSQRDYSMSLKLQIVREIERGRLSINQTRKNYGIQSRSTVVQWLRKFGNFDWENQTSFNMSRTPEQKIMELESQSKTFRKTEVILRTTGLRS